MTAIDIIIPTYGRAGKLAALAENIDDATVTPHRILFAVEAEDTDSIAAVKALGLEPVINEGQANYAGACNTGYYRGGNDLLFAGADDLIFHPGWDTAAIAKLDGWFGVIGTADLLNPYVAAGSHATHYLIERWYLDGIGGVVDIGPGSFLYEGYDHQYTDTEFIGTAKARARFRPCFESVVEHRHWLRTGEMDATAHKTQLRIEQDAALYDTRRQLWWNLSR